VFFLESADLWPPGWVRTPPKVRLRTIRMSTTVLIVDDSTPIRRSLRAWFEQRDGWEVCGEAENGAVAVERVQTLNPDVVILDLSMPVMNGLEAARKIASIAPKTAMVLFTMHASEHLVKDARDAGIKEVISKLDGPATLLASVESIAQKPRDPTQG
jgi:DNA-binding NarL/FixJ family response regulator